MRKHFQICSYAQDNRMTRTGYNNTALDAHVQLLIALSS